MEDFLTDEQIRDYHIGMTFESAWRAYAGMIETKQLTMDRVMSLVPESFQRELTNYFASLQNGLDGDYE